MTDKVGEKKQKFLQDRDQFVVKLEGIKDRLIEDNKPIAGARNADIEIALHELHLAFARMDTSSFEYFEAIDKKKE